MDPDSFMALAFKTSRRLSLRFSPVKAANESRRFSVSLNSLEEPGLGAGPVSLHGAFRKIEERRDFGFAESAKETELHNVRSFRSDGLQLVQGIVQLEEDFILGRLRNLDCIEFDPCGVPAMAKAHPAAGAIDQNVPHGLGRRREEMPPVLPLILLTAGEPKVSLVDQSGGLQGLARGEEGKLVGRRFPQFVLHERQQLLRRFRVACLGTFENLGNLVHGWTILPVFYMLCQERIMTEVRSTMGQSRPLMCFPEVDPMCWNTRPPRKTLRPCPRPPSDRPASELLTLEVRFRRQPEGDRLGPRGGLRPEPENRAAAVCVRTRGGRQTLHLLLASFKQGHVA